MSDSSRLTMSLETWIATYGYSAQPFVKEGCAPMMSIPPFNPNDHDANWDLHHLIDYVVTSYTGGSYWLYPRRAPEVSMYRPV